MERTPQRGPDPSSPSSPSAASARRRFSEPAKGGLRDVDSAERAQLLRALSLSLAGGVIGMLVGMVLAARVQKPGLALVLPLAGAAAGALGVFAATVLLMRGAGRAAGSLYNPSGSSTPHRREYSQAEARAVQGSYQDAVHLFQLAAAEHPDDPTPLLRAARIYRDALRQPEEALRCFRMARQASRVTEGQWRAVTRELIELLIGPMDRPLQSAPELARLAERASGTPEGEWAARELAEVKKLIASGEA